MRRGDGNSSILHHGGRLVSVERGLQRKAEVAGRRQSAGGATARAVRFRLISGWGPVRHCRGKAAPCEIEISRKGGVVVERKLASDLGRAGEQPCPSCVRQRRRLIPFSHPERWAARRKPKLSFPHLRRSTTRHCQRCSAKQPADQSGIRDR